MKDLNEEEDVKSARPDSGRRAYFCPSHKHMNSFKLFHLHGPIFCILRGDTAGSLSQIRRVSNRRGPVSNSESFQPTGARLKFGGTGACCKPGVDIGYHPARGPLALRPPSTASFDKASATVLYSR